MKGSSELCEVCGRPATAWTGRSRKYFRADATNPVMTAGWCKTHLHSRPHEANPTVKEVRRLYAATLVSSQPNQDESGEGK